MEKCCPKTRRRGPFQGFEVLIFLNPEAPVVWSIAYKSFWQSFASLMHLISLLCVAKAHHPIHMNTCPSISPYTCRTVGNIIRNNPASKRASQDKIGNKDAKWDRKRGASWCALRAIKREFKAGTAIK